MNRRRFLQWLPAGAGLCAATPAIAQSGSSQGCGSVVYAASGPITGPLARTLAPPEGAPPLPQSSQFKGPRFTGRQRAYSDTITADTWYPGWGPDDRLYSSYTDGAVKDAAGYDVRANSQWASPDGLHEYWSRDMGLRVARGRVGPPDDYSTTSGNAVLEGDDPFALHATPLPLFRRNSQRYEGYYPCANLVHRGIWYYGGYYCHRWLNTHNIPTTYELGGFGGFRISRDFGVTWADSPHDDRTPLFPEVGRCSGGAPIRMGTPHFVDFGKDLEHSPDGYAYLVGHGTYDPEGVSNWSSGDAISLARFRPSPETANDPAAWEFYAGHDSAGAPQWSHDFSRIAALIEWPGGAGCVNVTYQPALGKFIGLICGGWADGDSGVYNLWVVEADRITGPWKSVACLRGTGGGQPYFVCMPGKFNRGSDGKIVLFYSANWRKDRPGIPTVLDPHGPNGEYSLCVAEFALI